MFTFKDYLLTEAKKEGKEVKDKKASGRLFNPERFRQPVEKVLKIFIKASAAKTMGFEDMNDILLLEALSITKEVLVDRLEPFLENPDYRETKGDEDFKKLMQKIRDQIKETLHLNFPSLKRVMNFFLALVVDPILEEVRDATPAKAAKLINGDRYDEDAKDAFGRLMKFIIHTVVIPNAEDADIATKVLAKWSAQVRASRKKDKKITKAQRLNVIRAAAEAVQVDKEAEDRE